MERKFVPSNRQDWVPSGIQALKFVIFADMSIEDCWSFVKRGLINQLSKLYKHIDSAAIFLKQVEKFLINLLKMRKKKFGPFL